MSDAVFLSPRNRLSPEDSAALRRAVELLENPAFVARLANWAGVPVEQMLKRLPSGAANQIQNVVSNALRHCFDVAVYRMSDRPSWFRSESAMKALVAATGAAGGAFGLAAFAVELPVTTVVMLRSIAEIARLEGEDVATPAGALACLEVFALGGRSSADDESQLGYLGVRAALAGEINAALRFLASQPGRRAVAPALIQVLEKIAARFGIVVTEKAAAGAVPVIGAVGGATVNALFMDHFQDMAHGHFTVRRLERKYGADIVTQAYRAMLGKAAA